MTAEAKRMLGGPGDMMTSMSGMMWGMAFVWADRKSVV